MTADKARKPTLARNIFTDEEKALVYELFDEAWLPFWDQAIKKIAVDLGICIKKQPPPAA